MGAGAALSAYSQYRKGQVDAQVAENNAELARRQASDAMQRGAHAANEAVIEGRRVGASALVAAGANGVGGASVENTIATSSANAAVDAATIKANAVRQAWGFEAEANDLEAQAKEAKKAGLLGALGTGLSGAAQASSYAASK